MRPPSVALRDTWLWYSGQEDVIAITHRAKKKVTICFMIESKSIFFAIDLAEIGCFACAESRLNLERNAARIFEPFHTHFAGHFNTQNYRAHYTI